MKRSAALAGMLSFVLLIGVTGCGETAGFYDKDRWFTEGGALIPTQAAELPTAGDLGADVAVHDPSVFYDDATQKYYAFGTHFAVASSDDLITWEQEASDNQWDKLYGTSTFTYEGRTWPAALKEAVELVAPKEAGNDTITTTWAPDVMKIGSKYYMYFSITQAFGSSTSVIGRVESRNVMGPYSHCEILLSSQGMGGTPNCIDPELFYDKEGDLWMIYGSHYDGIYLKALNKSGLPVDSDPDSEEYFGTRVWKGGSTIVEGPYIFYHAETDYYYLVATYGALATNYNMRVARSKNPEGPYVDQVSGHNLAGSFSDANGVKLAGNYRFYGDQLRTAVGHCSVIKKDGQYLLVTHARNGNLMHHLEVHQLFFNKDGWPVMSPNRYVGEKAGTVTSDEIAGDYDVIVHTAGTTDAAADSVKYSLTADGNVLSGRTSAGTWALSDGYYFSITLGGTVYQGVVAPGWRAYGTKKGVLCMTAVSDAGIPVWLNAAD